MDKKEVKERIEKLRKLINYHRSLYHSFDSPEISDFAFDSLKNELEEFETKHPEFVTKNSPTQTVGGKPLEKFEKVSHETPMLSFNDAFFEAEMKEWTDRVQNYLYGNKKEEGNFLDISKQKFYCELKIDGLAIELVYKNGEFVLGSTRGDGKTGENITENLKTISSIPKKLEKLGKYEIPKNLIVRGEVFITNEEFKNINADQEKKGEKTYANPRNLAAGSVRQLDPKITASRMLKSFQYDIVSDLNFRVSTHEEKHKILASWGFCINEHDHLKNSLDDVFKFRNFWEKNREKLEYEVDGIVVILNNNNIFNSAGVVGKAPRGAIAYKFSAREATSLVLNVKLQIGRTGVLTPVAELKPVEVGGVTISRATLHNFDEIKKLGLKIGDTVIISRAGDVIPKVIGVIENLRTGKEKSVKIPNICPFDGSNVVKDGVAYRCSNKKCGGRNKEFLYHFVSRGAFDIRGLGNKIIDRFLDEGLISDAADIFSLVESEISVLDRFGEKSAQNIIEEIKQKKKTSLQRFLYSLGILHVGEETANILAQKIYNSKKTNYNPIEILKTLQKLSILDLQMLKDIGPKVAESIFNWFRNDANIKLLEKLEKAGIVIELKIKDVRSQKLSGLSFVFTGTLNKMTRDEAKLEVCELGGGVSESLNKKTSYLVLGENPGSKLEKAKKLEVKTINEEEFLEVLKK